MFNDDNIRRGRRIIASSSIKKKPSVQIQITPKSGPRGNAETLYKNIYVNVIRDVYTISHGTGW